MMNARALVICGCGIALLGQPVRAQEFSRYRSFDMESTLAAVSASTGVAVSEAKTVHEHPALLQNLEWRPSRWNAGTIASTDPVERMAFSFYDDRLYRIVVDYGHDRTDGMTDGDVIEAISATYGAPLRASPRARSRVASEVEAESGTPVARWGDRDHAIVLYRTSSYGQALRLVVTVLPIEGLARKAETQAVRLEAQDAPRRESVRLKKEHADGAAAAQKARIANKKGFEP
jgi:hypothetical protein